MNFLGQGHGWFADTWQLARGGKPVWILRYIGPQHHFPRIEHHDNSTTNALHYIDTTVFLIVYMIIFISAVIYFLLYL